MSDERIKQALAFTIEANEFLKRKKAALEKPLQIISESLSLEAYLDLLIEVLFKANQEIKTPIETPVDVAPIQEATNASQASQEQTSIPTSESVEESPTPIQPSKEQTQEQPIPEVIPNEEN
jgi:hypothetical protein